MDERIAMLRDRAFENGKDVNGKRKRMIFNRALYENRDEGYHNLKRAKTDRYMMEHYPVVIDPDEWIVGRFENDCQFTEEEQAELEKTDAYRDSVGSSHGANSAQTGHRVIDFEKLLHLGVSGILEEIESCEKKLDYTDPEDAEKYIFYQASRIEMDGLLTFAGRYREKLQQMAESASVQEKKERYTRLAGIFANVPLKPAETFYEAIQCVWFVQFTAHLLDDTILNGRPDDYLYPYYQKDIREGMIDDSLVMLLIENLYLKHNEIYNNWPASIMVGGVDKAGNPVWNELSRMMIDAIETTGLINPSVAVCYNEAIPEDLLYRCVDIISKGYTRPSIFNDRIVQKGLRAAGVSEEDARYYIHSTCVEITMIGSSNIRVATPYINLGKSLEYVLGGQKELFGEQCRQHEPVVVELSELNTFEAFSEKIKEVAAEIIRAYLVGVCRNEYFLARCASTPFVSVFTNDCIIRGKDGASGGARYNFIYPCFPGFLNLVDSLAAIRKAVYEEKVVTLEELGTVLKNNYEDEARLRSFLMNRCPKFGNDQEEADQIAVEYYEFIRQELKKYRTCIGGTFHPSYFAWIMHGVLGKQAAATPDGRLQGEALSECLGAVQGMDKNGPFAVMHSVSKIDQQYGIGGIATNFRFSKAMLSDEAGKKALADFIRVFMENDCFEIQFNVVDQEILLEAQVHPEKYRTLMVRVAGYSDYFVNLDPVIQNEIIRRSEHGELV